MTRDEALNQARELAEKHGKPCDVFARDRLNLHLGPYSVYVRGTSAPTRARLIFTAYPYRARGAA